MRLTLNDYAPAARKRLPRPLYGYVAGASETGAAHEDNEAVFRETRLVPRVLRGVEGRTSRQSLLDQAWSAPFGIAPMGIAALMALDGDREMARAGADAGIPYVLSGSSLTPMERVIEANPDAWFQAYLPGEVARIEALIARVRRAGFKTLVLTVDTAVLANRENNVRAGFSTPLRMTPRMLLDFGCRPRWVFGCFARTLLRVGVPHFENSYAERGAPIVSKDAVRDFGRKDHLNWEHVGLIRRLWPGKLVLKGLLAAQDVARAREHGCDGVILSNHGGRQLDYAIAGVRALAGAREVAGGMALMVDGGIRRGTDVIKALALGADFVFLGRPFLFAASISGRQGVAEAIEILRLEVHRDLGLLGLNGLDEVDASILQPMAGNR